MDRIPYGRQDINEQDIEAVVEVLRSDFLTQGSAVPAFESSVAQHCGAAYSVAMNSATSALHLSCLALGVGRGDWVWTSAITFVASSNAALYCGASVDFVDINPQSYNISVECLAEKLCKAEKIGKLPKVVIAVHLCGQSCDMKAIHMLGKRYGFKIVEDASHAIGGDYMGQPVGSCLYSDITVFSFHPVKIITTGEGGVAVTNDQALAKKMTLLRSHGITNSIDELIERPLNEIWNYQQITLGFNYRMTDIQAALGLSQMQRLGEFVDKRRSLAASYDEFLGNLPIIRPWQSEEAKSSFHLYVIRVQKARCGKSQKEIYASLCEAGIGVNVHYIPVYRQPYYESIGFVAGHCPEAERYYKEAITLPLFPALTKSNHEKVVTVLKKVLP